MEQFSLEKHLENPSRKVVTRDGREVEIVKYDMKGTHFPVLYVISNEDGSQEPCECSKSGMCQFDNTQSSTDLFFADEEEELTELQKTLEEDCDCYVNLYNDGKTREELREWIKCWCNSIIYLARKELEKENPYNGNQKQEWSEEDSERLLRIHQFIWANRKGDTDEIYQQEQDADWIMSLNPQQNNYDKGYNDGYSAAKYNQWKPTDKQMEDFRMLLDYNIGVFDYAKFMSVNSLYDDLKKNIID